MHKTIQTVKVYYILYGNILIAMEVPRFSCLFEFQGVKEQNVPRSPKYLMNQMTNYGECILIYRTFDVHIEVKVMPSKRPTYEG